MSCSGEAILQQFQVSLAETIDSLLTLFLVALVNWL